LARLLIEASSRLHRALTITPDHQGMSRTPHTSNPRLALGLAALSAGLFLAGCTGRDEPVATQPGVLAATAPSTGPEQSVTSATSPIPTSPTPTSPVPATPVTTIPRPVVTTATTSAAPSADLDQSLAGIDRDLADLDHQLTDADHDVATPEGDIR
jgi:hypothetical protein